MRLEVDFSELWTAVKKMGAESVDFSIKSDGEELEPIDIELKKGKDVDLNEVVAGNVLLNVQGRQILLYIPDQGYNIEEVLQDGIHGRRFHVADCVTLKEMRQKGRYERYVATNDLGDHFAVHGTNPATREEIKDSAELKVCKNCLNELNYKNYRYGSRNNIHKGFKISYFFEEYSSFFEYYPSEFRAQISGYSSDWKEISKNLRKEKNFTCESCSVCLDSQRKLLHVHHVNGVKADNRKTNLQVLCKACHAEQPMHGHMLLSHIERKQITKVRRTQGLLSTIDWTTATKYCDPGLKGVVYICKKRGVNAPEIGLDIQGLNTETIGILEVAWPKQRVAIAINNSDIEAGIADGWKVWSMSEVIENEDDFINKLFE